MRQHIIYEIKRMIINGDFLFQSNIMMRLDINFMLSLFSFFSVLSPTDKSDPRDFTFCSIHLFLQHTKVLYTMMSSLKMLASLLLQHTLGSLDESNMVVRSTMERKLHRYQIAEMKCIQSNPDNLIIYEHFNKFLSLQFSYNIR